MTKQFVRRTVRSSSSGRHLELEWNCINVLYAVSDRRLDTTSAKTRHLGF